MAIVLFFGPLSKEIINEVLNSFSMAIWVNRTQK